METDKRAQLLQRRRMLQLRLEREDVSRQFRGVAPALRARGLRFRKLLPAFLSPWLRVLARLPGRDERIFWPEVGDGACATWQDDRDCAAALERALRACEGLDGRVMLVFHPAQAALVSGARDLVGAWEALHEALYEATWLVPMDRRPWLIEISPADYELCFVTDVP